MKDKIPGLLSAVNATVSDLPKINYEMARYMENFSKPTIDPRKITLTPKMAGFMMIMCPPFRRHVGPEISQAFDGICQQACAKFEASAATGVRTQEFVKIVNTHTYANPLF